MKARDINFLAGETASSAMRQPTDEEKQAEERLHNLRERARHKGWGARQTRRYLEREMAKIERRREKQANAPGSQGSR